MHVKSKIIAASVLSIFFSGTTFASAEFMTEAERRAQLVEIAEQAKYRPEKKKPISVASKKDLSVATAAVYVHEAMFEDNAYPQYQPGTIVIRTGERVLHYIEDQTTMRTYPIAVGRDGAQWVGTTKVTHKRKNPEWRPTPNMRKRNPKLPEVVKAGPSNPLGIRAIYLAEGYLRIHGTNEPKSIGKAASSGCYRMHNEHVSELYELVQGGAKVVVLK